jgi:hypothetical protein
MSGAAPMLLLLLLLLPSRAEDDAFHALKSYSLQQLL